MKERERVCEREGERKKIQRSMKDVNKKATATTTNFFITFIKLKQKHFYVISANRRKKNNNNEKKKKTFTTPYGRRMNSFVRNTNTSTTK